jgi:hypothetical protein
VLIMAQDEGRFGRVSRPKRMPGPLQASVRRLLRNWCANMSRSLPQWLRRPEN